MAVDTAAPEAVPPASTGATGTRTSPWLFRFRGYTLSRNVAAVHAPEPCYLIAELDFDDRASLQAAFQYREGQATAGDVATVA